VYDAIQLPALEILWFIFGFIIVLMFKNSIQKLDNFKANIISVLFTSVVFYYSIISVNKLSEFLYFNF